MTEKAKKQLFNSPILVSGVLIAPLGILVVFCLLTDSSSLYILALGLLAILLYLFALRSKLISNQSQFQLNIQNYRERMNLIIAEIERQENVTASFQKKIVNYAQLKGFTERLGLCLNLDETSKTISSEVNKLFGGKDSTVILYVFHSKTGELGLSSSQKGPTSINLKTKRGDNFDRWVVKTLQPLLIEDTNSDYRFDIDQIKTEESREIGSLISAPMTVGGKAIGIVRVDCPKRNHFTMEELRLLMTIGDLSAVAVENAQLYERVEQLAIRDGLTGLYLKHFMMSRLPSEISRHLRRKKELSLLMIDLDYFKDYNDKYGHTAGDIVLKTISKLMTKLFDVPGNLLCRYGGEEFCVILSECTKKEAKALADKFRERVNETQITLRRQKTIITVSIGIASSPKDAHNHKELIHFADMVLYRAKNNGRNRVEMYLKD